MRSAWVRARVRQWGARLAGGAGALVLVAQAGLAGPGARLLSPPVALAQGADQAVPGGRYYTQTGGFGITNQRGMPFYNGFMRLGGVAVLGYPVTRRFFLAGFVCQGMQGGLLQYLPDTNQVVLTNTFEMLSDFGQDEWLYARGIPRPIKNDGSSSFEEAVQIRLGWLTEPRIAAAYMAPPPGWNGTWTTNDAVNRYGLPMSRPESFGPFTSQRFQRVAFQLWQQSVPGMPPPGSVTQALAGDLVKDSGILGPVAVVPQASNDDFAVPVDLTVEQRNQTVVPRRSGPFSYSVSNSASGKTFPLVPSGAAAPAVPPGSTALVTLVSVTNAGPQPAAPSEQTVRLRDKNGAMYQASLPLSTLAAQALTAQTPAGAVVPGSPVAPGASATVPLAFTVPEGSGPWMVVSGGGEAAPPIDVREPDPGVAADEPTGETPVTIAPAPAVPPAATPAPIPTAVTPQRTSEQVLPGVVRLRVLQVTRPFDLQPPAPAGQEYLAVRVELENLSPNNLPFGVSTLAVRVRGALVRGEPTGAADSLAGGQLAAGQTAGGTVAFAVPLGAQVTSILFTVANNTLEVPFP